LKASEGSKGYLIQVDTNSTEALSCLEQIFDDTFTHSDFDFTHSLTQDDVEEWDSLNQIRLLMAIEMEFDIKFELEEMEHLIGVESLLDSIGRKIS